MKSILFFILLTMTISITGCQNQNVYSSPKIQVNSFERETVEIELPLQLVIDNTNGNMKIYNWNRESIQFDITKRITGTDTKDKLSENIEEIDYSITQQDNKVIFSSIPNEKLKNSSDYSMDIELYLPRHIELLSLSLAKGEVKFYDDLNCELILAYDEADISINHFDGMLTAIGDKGNIEISGGTMLNADININVGNVDIKSKFETMGKHNIKTCIGNVNLLIPEKTYLEFLQKESKQDHFAYESLSGSSLSVSTGTGEINIDKW